MPNENVNLVGVTAPNILQAIGLFALGFSKVVLAPSDIPGAVTAIVQGLQILGVTLTPSPNTPTSPVIVNGIIH